MQEDKASVDKFDFPKIVLVSVSFFVHFPTRGAFFELLLCRLKPHKKLIGARNKFFFRRVARKYDVTLKATLTTSFHASMQQIFAQISLGRPWHQVSD